MLPPLRFGEGGRGERFRRAPAKTSPPQPPSPERGGGDRTGAFPPPLRSEGGGGGEELGRGHLAPELLRPDQFLLGHGLTDDDVRDGFGHRRPLPPNPPPRSGEGGPDPTRFAGLPPPSPLRRGGPGGEV